jgi:hypothetical protein
MHGFYLNREEKRITFDIIIDFDEEDRDGLYQKVCEEIRAAYPDYQVDIALDLDISD